MEYYNILSLEFFSNLVVTEMDRLERDLRLNSGNFVPLDPCIEDTLIVLLSTASTKARDWPYVIFPVTVEDVKMVACARDLSSEVEQSIDRLRTFFSDLRNACLNIEERVRKIDK